VIVLGAAIAVRTRTLVRVISRLDDSDVTGSCQSSVETRP
jgi:hypothetical protein